MDTLIAEDDSLKQSKKDKDNDEEIFWASESLFSSSYVYKELQV
jgi:hypothetical protein